MNELIFVIAALGGVFVHWFKSWCRNQVQGSFWYLLRSEPKQTGLTLLALLSGLYALHSTGSLSVMNEQSLALAFLSGFSANSAFNKEGVRDG